MASRAACREGGGGGGGGRERRKGERMYTYGWCIQLTLAIPIEVAFSSVSP